MSNELSFANETPDLVFEKKVEKVEEEEDVYSPFHWKALELKLFNAMKDYEEQKKEKNIENEKVKRLTEQLAELSKLKGE